MAAVRFAAEDTSIEIAPDALGRLLAAFEQTDASTARRQGGTGPGLVITKNIADAMGGAAACLLGISRDTLRYRLDRLQLRSVE